MSILEARLQRRGANNLDFLRFLAAALVVVHHSIALLGYSWDPLGSLTGYCSLGQLGVNIFFCMSGLLVARSWLDEPRPGVYAAKRALRILPGLWMVLLLGVFVAGPLLSRLSVSAYFSNPNTMAYLRGLAVFPVRYSLPGVFLENPKHAFNGSLWTLPFELQAYTAILAAGWLGYLTRRRFPWMLAAAGAGQALAILHGTGKITSTPAQVHFSAGDECNLFFLAGAALYVYRDALKIDGRLALLALAAWLGTLSTGWPGYAVGFLALPYLLVYAALAPVPGLNHWARHGDLSYGMYIYAFPIQQTFVWWLGYRHLSILQLTALSLPATMLAAWISWHAVEKPAMGLARRRRTPRRPIVEPPVGMSVAAVAQPLPSMGSRAAL